jgi:hypothetical protein
MTITEGSLASYATALGEPLIVPDRSQQVSLPSPTPAQTKPWSKEEMRDWVRSNVRELTDPEIQRWCTMSAQVGYTQITSILAEALTSTVSKSAAETADIRAALADLPDPPPFAERLAELGLREVWIDGHPHYVADTEKAKEFLGGGDQV